MPLKYEVSMLMSKCTCALLGNVLATSSLDGSTLMEKQLPCLASFYDWLSRVCALFWLFIDWFKKSHSYARTHYKTSNKITRTLRVIKKNSFILMACNLITMMLVSRKVLRKYIWQYWKSVPLNASERRINFVEQSNIENLNLQ